MFELKPSEIRKVEKFANKLSGKKDCRITGYFHSGKDDMEFVTVKCEICSNDMSEREDDVYLEAFLLDRRRSFARKPYRGEA